MPQAPGAVAKMMLSCAALTVVQARGRGRAGGLRRFIAGARAQSFLVVHVAALLGPSSACEAVEVWSPAHACSVLF